MNIQFFKEHIARTIFDFRILQKILVLLIILSSFSECYSADGFSNYLDKIDRIVSQRDESPKSIYKIQREILIEHEDIKALSLDDKRTKEYKQYHERRESFDNGGRRKLRKEWERQYSQKGIEWPCYHCNDCCRGQNNCLGYYFEAHHVIPLGYNGENEWWNIFPLSQAEHTGINGIHSSDEAKAIFTKYKHPKEID